MNVGTKSVLYGAHAFWLHPWFVALAWWKLYGFPWDPRLWVAFFVHDLGYWGSPNMDGPEGERHPERAALYMDALFDGRSGKTVDWSPTYFDGAAFVSYVRRDGTPVRRYLGKWGTFVLLHSRFYAKKHRLRPSRLCMADKLALFLTPSWLYVPMARATGEIHEYRNAAELRNDGENVGTDYEWHQAMGRHMASWALEHQDGRADTWTPDQREARDDAGVWQ